jgi:hypothetical protein
VIVAATGATTTSESKLPDLISKGVSEFPKLETGEPYDFERWADDRTGSTCLYYWFSSHDGGKRNNKRIVVLEMLEAFQHPKNMGSFDRNAFRRLCPVSESSGPRGFVVVGQILEALGVAVYSGREKGFLKPRSS